MDESLFAFNGINGATGDFLLPPMSAAELAAVAQSGTLDPAHLAELQQRWQSINEAHFGAVEGVDTSNLAEAGWGVIFAHDSDPAIREALEPLLAHRRKLASQNDPQFFKEYSGPNGFRPGETKQKFLARHGAGPGPADPKKVPYYLLIVGSPEQIPFSFQFQLDVQYAVGRLHFDTPAEYAAYAQTVVASESGQIPKSRDAVFFGVQSEDDRATQLSLEHLVTPLAKTLTNDASDWKVSAHLGKEATRARLSELLCGGRPPGLLFSACHGMGFPKDDPRQLRHQGALLCSDWPGPKQWRKPIPEEFYFSADQIPDGAAPTGSILFSFACYGAGTPRLDDFAHGPGKTRGEIAPHAFVAGLPRRLLGHPKGGALAMIGHVERAWGCSFVWERAGEQLGVFESALRTLTSGLPVGAAMEYFNQRYAELSSDLSVQLEEVKFGAEVDPMLLTGLWTANNDARSYVILGDPAVRCPS